jgi:hypothetical protein
MLVRVKIGEPLVTVRLALFGPRIREGSTVVHWKFDELLPRYNRCSLHTRATYKLQRDPFFLC